MLPDVTRKSLGDDIISVFSPWLEESEAIPLFKPLAIPGLIVRGAGLYRCSLVRDLYLFHTAFEAMYFASINPQIKSCLGSTVFACTGYLPKPEQVLLMRQAFTYAKLHLAFDKDVAGKVADCKAALWWAGKDCRFISEDNAITCRYEGRKITIPMDVFSLHRFKLQSGFRSDARTHKAPSGFTSYLDLFWYALKP